ncbi:MAG: hypothetical protein WAS27_01235, partial [Candidatus Saccharimonadales bacterium]
FTLTELIIAISVSIVLIVASIGLYLSVSSQIPFIVTRNTLSTNLENALNRINDDVRISSGVAVYNTTPDANAPTTKTGYTAVPGPDSTDTNDNYFWRMSSHRLILNQTPVSSSGQPIYDVATTAVGKRNTIVYYVKDSALYRRVIAAEYTNNVLNTVTCPRIATGGCQDKDVKILDNLDPTKGEAAFTVTYYDKNGTKIPNTKQDAGGNDVPDYTGFSATRSVEITIVLRSKEVKGTQTVALDNDMRMTLRRTMTEVVPASNAALIVGGGGLDVGGGGATVTSQGNEVYVLGNVTIGGASWVGGTPIARWNIANLGCATAAGDYPKLCTTPPIKYGGGNAGTLEGDICAVGRPASQGASLYHLNESCVPPILSFPYFDKAAHVSSITKNPGTHPTCGVHSGPITLQENAKYDNVHAGNCQMYLSGDIYVTGNFNISNTASLKVREGVTTPPVVMVNGRVTVTNPSEIRANSAGVKPFIISFYSADTECSNSDTCAVANPARLFASIQDSFPTAIDLGGGSYSEATMYAYFGKMSVCGGVAHLKGAAAAHHLKICGGSPIILAPSNPVWIR